MFAQWVHRELVEGCPRSIKRYRELTFDDNDDDNDDVDDDDMEKWH